jgi:integrase
MATANLTKRVVDALKFSPECDYLIWDKSLKGFGVRVTERRNRAGETLRRKVFVVGYRPRGSRQFKRLTLGTFGPVTVEQARAEALRQLASVSSGADPLQAKQADRATLTVRELGAAYLADVKVRRKPRTAAEYARLWNKHVLTSLGAKKVNAVATTDLRRLHRSMDSTPYLANRVMAMLGAFFSFASKEGARPQHDNPAHGVDFFPEQGRERFLTPDEFRRLGAALTQAEQVGLPPAPQHRRKPKAEATKKHIPKKSGTPIPANPYAVAAIRLLALTGCREGEILSLRWEAVDLEHGYLRLADTKTGRSNRPLGESAATVLRGLKPIKDNPYVFPGVRTGEHLKEIKRVWFAVRQAAKLDELRLHDLRHSYASVPASSGESLLVVRFLLGHARVATTERYAHLGADPVKRAADRASNDIAGWLSGQQTSLTPIRRAK